MKKVGLVIVSIVPFICSGAQAAPDWVQTRQGSFGLGICMDRNSIEKDKAGLTHFDIEICGDTVAMHFAVDCSQDFSRQITFHERYPEQGSTPEHWADEAMDPEHWSDEATDSDSGTFADAKLVCGK